MQGFYIKNGPRLREICFLRFPRLGKLLHDRPTTRRRACQLGDLSGRHQPSLPNLTFVIGLTECAIEGGKEEAFTVLNNMQLCTSYDS